MAIAGGGEPAMCVHIWLGELRQLGLAHNVDAMVIKTPEEAAKLLAAGKPGGVYISSIGGAAERTWAILAEMGVIEPLK